MVGEKQEESACWSPKLEDKIRIRIPFPSAISGCYEPVRVPSTLKQRVLSLRINSEEK